MNQRSILVVDDEADIRTLIKEILSDEGYRVETAADAASARTQMVAVSPDLVLLDIWMPDTDGISLLSEWSSSGEMSCPVVIMSGHGTVETAVEATRLGAADFIEKPLSLNKLLRTVEKILEKPISGGSADTGQASTRASAPVGRSPQMQSLRQQAAEMAAHGAPVLITGETGSGREAFARYLHVLSARRNEPFLKVVTSALSAENAACALLGTESSGGIIEAGYLERADGGTLFIDELADSCEEVQRLLFGVLSQGSYARIGRAQQIPIDVRVIASLRPSSGVDGNDNAVRSDLIEKLSVTHLQVPPLRDYAEDVPDLLQHFVEKLVENVGLTYRRFGVAAQNRLRNYPWPGNVSELSNMVQRLLLKGGPEEIGLSELEAELKPAAPGNIPLVEQDLLSMPLREAREQFERAYLKQQLLICHGKVGQLAKRVGMERTHLYRKLRTLGIDFRQT
jgi:two-component system nitrogen regulation response regulator NtrX